MQVSSAYRSLLALGHLARDLVGQQPDVLGRADQVDDREVDLDEVGEVAERRRTPRSASRSLRHPAAGWRAASSETIRGDADPTWWTCSSALGRPAMKCWRLTPAQCRRGAVSCPARPSLPRSSADGRALVTCSPLTKTVGVQLTPAFGRRRAAAVTQRLERHVLDAGGVRRPRSRRPRRRGPPGRPCSGTGPARTAGCRRAGRGRPWPPRDPTRRAPRRTRWRPRRVVADPLEDGKRAVLDLDVARLDGGVELVARPSARADRRTGRGSPRRRRPSSARRRRRRPCRSRRSHLPARCPACRSRGC